MTDKELRKLSRAELLEMLIEQSGEMQKLREKLAVAEESLRNREIAIEKSGSIAEAALQLNGVFEAAQLACQQYTDNLEQFSRRQEEICAQREAESQAKASQIIADAEKKREELERETRKKCIVMVRKAKAEAQRYWDEVSAKLDDYYAKHTGLRELLSISTPGKS